MMASGSGDSLFTSEMNDGIVQGNTSNPRKVFVGNISFEVRSGELKSFFGSFGNVKHVQLLWDRSRRRFKGSAFVTFCSIEGAEMAKNSTEGERTLNGRIMTVSAVENKRRRRKEKEVPNDGVGNNFSDMLTEDKSTPEVPAPDNLYQDGHSYSKHSTSLNNEGAVPFHCLSDEAPSTDREDSYPTCCLPDDILLKVFSYLLVADRIRIERVCKQWRHVALLSWQSVRTLHFENVFQGLFAKGQSVLTHAILKSVLQRGCQNLQSLDISASPTLLTSHSCELIGRECPNLSHINLSGMRINNRDIQELSRQCSKLKKVELKRCKDIGEKGFWWLFKHCHHIEYFDCQENMRITGQCFHILNPSCHTVYVDECGHLSDMGISRLTTKCPDLRTLGISKCYKLTGASITRIAEDCKSLETLYMGGDFPSVSSDSLCQLQKLPQLRNLYLKNNLGISFDVLQRLSIGCSGLRYLDISGCYKNVNDDAIICLSACHSLEDLNISYVDKVTDKSIESLAISCPLKRFIMRGCMEITDQALLALANHCHTLTELDVSGCEDVTDRGIQEFIQHRDRLDPDEKDQYPVLLLTIGGTSVSEPLPEFYPGEICGVKISFMDFSIPQRRLQMENYGRFFPSDEEEEEEDWDAEIEMTQPPVRPPDHSHHLDELGVDNMEEWNNQRQMHYGTTAFAIPEDYVDDFLDADDPAMWDDEFFVS